MSVALVDGTGQTIAIRIVRGSLSRVRHRQRSVRVRGSNLERIQTLAQHTLKNLLDLVEIERQVIAVQSCGQWRG